MQRNAKNQLFSQYFKEWVKIYKEGAIKPITLKKYYMSQHYLEQLAPKLKVNQITRKIYQQLINDYALTHEKQTTMDFHHQIKSAILDAVDDGLIAPSL